METFNDLLSPAILFAEINQHKNAHLSIESKQSEMSGGELSASTVHTIFSWYSPDGLKFIVMHYFMKSRASERNTLVVETEKNSETVVFLIRD